MLIDDENLHALGAYLENRAAGRARLYLLVGAASIVDIC